MNEMLEDRAASVLPPLLAEIRDDCRVTERLVDSNAYQVNIATLWANLVLNPEDSGFAESELERCYDVISEESQQVLGRGTTLRDTFSFLTTKAGAEAMASARLNQTHKDMLLYFASMMLDPEGHRRWSEELRDQLDR